MKRGFLECPNCGTEFEPKRRHQRFCKTGCRVDHWVKIHPRVEIEKPFRLGKTEDGRLVVIQEIPAGARTIRLTLPDEPGGNHRAEEAQKRG